MISLHDQQSIMRKRDDGGESTRHGEGLMQERGVSVDHSTVNRWVIKFSELAEALDTLTTAHPLVLVLEDLQWSDVATLAWLAYVARRPDRARLLLRGTYRPADASTSPSALFSTGGQSAAIECGILLAAQSPSPEAPLAPTGASASRSADGDGAAYP
jgi:hypothetical protein